MHGNITLRMQSQRTHSQVCTMRPQVPRENGANNITGDPLSQFCTCTVVVSCCSESVVSRCSLECENSTTRSTAVTVDKLLAIRITLAIAVVVVAATGGQRMILV